MYKSDLLEKYIELFNHGVESSDFEPMLELFDENAVYEFEDPRIGIFEGRDSIARMLRLQGPSSPMSVFNIKETDAAAIADYADDIAPLTRLGGIKLFSSNGKIKKLIIKR
jgi:hypothetical protein